MKYHPVNVTKRTQEGWKSGQEKRVQFICKCNDNSEAQVGRGGCRQTVKKEKSALQLSP